MSASPEKPADIAVVLGGDGFGNRILLAGDMERRGIVSKVLVNGRLVGSYFGDPGHMAVFTKTFNGL